jgi:hypothetical protein
MEDDVVVRTRRGIDVRIVFALCVITAVVAMGVVRMWPAGATGAPTRPVDRTINSYVLFALDNISLKGGNAQVAEIDNGDVGVQSDQPSDSLNLCQGGSSHQTKLGDGTQANSANFNTSSACSFWDVYSNHLVGTPTIRNSGPTPFTTPLIPPASLPPFPSFSCNPASPVTVPNNASQSLAPGTYGNVQIKDGAKLTLTGGTYTFCNISMGQNTSLIDVDATIVQVAGTVNTDGGTVGPSANAQFFVRGDGAGGGVAVGFGREGTVAGTWWVPNNQMNLGHGTDLTGHFWALRLQSDFNIQVHGVKAPCVDP